MKNQRYYTDKTKFKNCIIYVGGVSVKKHPEKEIILTAESSTKMYDGTELINNNYKITKGKLRKGDKIHDISINGSIINVGTVDNVISNAVIYDSHNKDVTFLYDIEYVNGTLDITPRKIMITSSSDKKVFDGAALTNDEITVSSPGFVTGEDATYDVTGTQTLIGSSENSFTYNLSPCTNPDNYDITTVFGNLSVVEYMDDEHIPNDLIISITDSYSAQSGQELTIAHKYTIGETAEFIISVINPYENDRTITLISIDMMLTQATFENVPAGSNVSTTGTHTITQTDSSTDKWTAHVTANVDGISCSAERTIYIKKYLN